MKTKNIIITAVIGLILVSFTGCSLLKKRVEKKETVKYTLNGSNKTIFHINNTNGKINIHNSTDTNGIIYITAEKVADVKFDEQDKPIESVKITIDTVGNEININTETSQVKGIFQKRENAKVNYDIKIPANMKTYVENVNGTITITRISNDIKAETVNGYVNIFNCPGKLDLSGVNGKITCNVDSITSGINISIINGDVRIGGLKGVDADVNVSTINGRVKFKDLSFTDVNSEKRNLNGILGKGGSMIRVESTNGKISLDAGKILPKKDDSFEFKIDFDDLEGPSMDFENDSKFENHDESEDTHKDTHQDKNDSKMETPKAPKSADSTKK